MLFFQGVGRQHADRFHKLSIIFRENIIPVFPKSLVHDNRSCVSTQGPRRSNVAVLLVDIILKELEMLRLSIKESRRSHQRMRSDVAGLLLDAFQPLKQTQVLVPLLAVLEEKLIQILPRRPFVVLRNNCPQNVLYVSPRRSQNTRTGCNRTCLCPVICPPRNLKVVWHGATQSVLDIAS
eukprot:3852407-Rhodomonas_salina.3